MSKGTKLFSVIADGAANGIDVSTHSSQNCNEATIFTLMSYVRGTVAVLANVVVASIVSVANCEEQARITVFGDSKIFVVPDNVVITAAIETRAPTVATATEQNSGQILAVFDFLKKSGVEEKYIQTELISIEPIIRESIAYSGKGGRKQAQVQTDSTDDPFGSEPEASSTLKPEAFQVTQQFGITVTDLTKFDAVYQGLIGLGINRVRRVELRTSELKKHSDLARLGAVRAAKEKAEAMANELGATLSSVLTITEKGGHGYRGGDDPFGSHPFGSEPSTGPTIAAGQIAISASVEVVFILGNTAMPLGRTK